MQLAQVDLNIADEAINRGAPGTANLDPVDGTVGFGSLISSVLSFVMLVAAILVLLYLLWGGMEWITSGGDKSKLEKARQRITSAILGIVVLAGTLAIFSVVQQFLGIEVFTF